MAVKLFNLVDFSPVDGVTQIGVVPRETCEHLPGGWDFQLLEALFGKRIHVLVDQDSRPIGYCVMLDYDEDRGFMLYRGILFYPDHYEYCFFYFYTDDAVIVKKRWSVTTDVFV